VLGVRVHDVVGATDDVAEMVLRGVERLSDRWIGVVSEICHIDFENAVPLQRKCPYLET
jgi:hypothetical protein